MRRITAIALLGFFVGAGFVAARLLTRMLDRRPPDPAAVLTQVREVARLETLDLTLYKKVAFSPDPEPGNTLWADVLNWARYAVSTPRGKAIVFADAHLGIDLSQLDADHIRIDGGGVYIQLPPVRARIEIKPADTEVIDSNLDSAATAKLFELAREAFERQVEADASLEQRARASAERAIRGLLYEVGFTRVEFVERAPAAPPS